MGCSESKEPEIPKLKITVISQTNGIEKSKFNRQDFIISKLNRESGISPLVIRENGQICGQQFIVEDCRDSSIFLLDRIECVTVDSCHNIVLVVGPTIGSVFLRDVHDSIVIVICQQLRLRDCHNVKVFLFSVTGPIIESSHNISFQCSGFSYPGIENHFAQNKFDIWNNKWDSVYDFTPEGDPKAHFTYLDPSKSADQLLLEKLDDSNISLLQSKGILQANFSYCIWPITKGLLQVPVIANAVTVLLLCLGDLSSILLDGVCKLDSSISLLCTKSTLLRPEIEAAIGPKDATRLKLGNNESIICLRLITSKGFNKDTASSNLPKQLIDARILMYIGDVETSKLCSQIFEEQI